MQTPLEKRINCVKNDWLLRIGKNELLRHLEGGKPLTMKDAIAAKCYDCNCGYDAGEDKDCTVYMCPLYDFMPYKKGGPRKRKGKPMTEEHKAILKKASKKRKESLSE